MPRETDRDWDPELYKKVDRYHLVDNLEQCLQCGKCTGNCPVAAITPSYNPRAIINDVLSGSTRLLIVRKSGAVSGAPIATGCAVDINYPLLMMKPLYGIGKRVRANM